MNPEDLRVILATDCGSTTTKAVLIQYQNDEYRQTHRGEAPTTVEAPFEDVTRGVLNAIQEIEELSGRTILDGETIRTPAHGSTGVDIYISTSSAGGGLQMVVSGVVQAMSAESAQRCALGAGAIVMDVLAANDGRPSHEKIERIRQLRPDMILFAGGTDGGTVSHVVEVAEYIAAADPKPRLGLGYKLPVIYAGNRDVRTEVQNILGEKVALSVTENIRPVLEQENLRPARQKSHDLFLEHVMAQAPGYKRLVSWAGAPIIPTPAAVGMIIETVARREGLNVIGVDIGGATTDVFSVFDEIFNRTVSANLGMSYSVANVVAEAGLEHIQRWLPFPYEESRLRNQITNKMIRPTTIPQTVEDLHIEHAIAREALRLALEQHKQLAVGLKGVQQERSVSDAFEQAHSGQSLIELFALDLVIGSGGVLSHAPRRVQAMQMLVDAYLPLGLTQIAVDSIFMMPHLGVLSTVHEQAATEVFHKDCLIPLGTCIAPNGVGNPGEPCFSYALQFPDGTRQEGEVTCSSLIHIPLGLGQAADIELRPSRKFDFGAGRGKTLTGIVTGGEVGLLLDARGRPLPFPTDEDTRVQQVREWHHAGDMYPAQQGRDLQVSAPETHPQKFFSP